MKLLQIGKMVVVWLLVLGIRYPTHCQTVAGLNKNGIPEKKNPDLKWFLDAKFGLFIHWGLYSQLAGQWKGQHYYGSGEWIMSRAKIPVKEYEKVAADFNPVDFNGDKWAQLAKEAGIRYMVITAKHHEGFAMYDSKVSDFNIVKATPYKKDPMTSLARAAAKRGIRFGFYYSQFQDWHEPNGGKNSWDFDEAKKNYRIYYRQKAIPQLKELLTNYGPLGVVWFDTPGGLSREETQNLVDSLRLLQPHCLFSSRVGYGLGDYQDFGDSEIPPVPIEGAWESVYTHNDSWGYIRHDMDFKSSYEIIQLLASVCSKGGNLMLNVGPDGKGNIPPYSVQFLKETGRWLSMNGQSIYGTTSGCIPPQPWGVTTSLPGKLFLHVFHMPYDQKIVIPGFPNQVIKAYQLTTKKPMAYIRRGKDILLRLPFSKPGNPDEVYVLEYKGTPPAYPVNPPVVVSAQFPQSDIGAISATTEGGAFISSVTYSHYYGDWKHATCIGGMQGPGDSVVFRIRMVEPGDYRVILEYACSEESAGQEGVIRINGDDFLFLTLRTTEYLKGVPLMFIQHPVAITKIGKEGIYTITVAPYHKGKELFKLKSVILKPVK